MGPLGGAAEIDPNRRERMPAATTYMEVNIMRIQHNIMAMNAYRNYTSNTSALAKNLEKLSSGYKINRAGDDAAGLAISEKMRAQITGLKAAQKNAKDGISLVQTAEGALTEVHDMLNRMVDLADQSANGTYDDETDRANLQKEFDALRTEIDRIADSSNFNGIKLLDGSLADGVTSTKVSGGYGKVISTVTNAAGTPTVTVAASATGNKGKETVTINATPTDGTEQTLKVDFVLDGKAHSITFKGTAAADTAATDATDALFGDADAIKAFKDLGINVTKNGAALVFEMEDPGKTDFTVYGVAHTNDGTAATAPTAAHTTAGTDSTLTMNLSAAAATDKIQFEVDGKQFQIVKTGGSADAGYTALYTDTGTVADADATASVIDQLKNKGVTASNDGTAGHIVFKKGDSTTSSSGGSGTGLTLQIGDSAEDFNQLTVSVNDMHAQALGIANISIAEQASAKAAMESIKSAINSVSSTRGGLGALQNRLDHTISNLSVMQENIQDAEASIRDVDVAEEMMAYTKNNILVQSAQAMLAQANQIPQGVLQLLQ